MGALGLGSPSGMGAPNGTSQLHRRLRLDDDFGAFVAWEQRGVDPAACSALRVFVQHRIELRMDHLGTGAAG